MRETGARTEREGGDGMVVCSVSWYAGTAVRGPMPSEPERNGGGVIFFNILSRPPPPVFSGVIQFAASSPLQLPLAHLSWTAITEAVTPSTPPPPHSIFLAKPGNQRSVAVESGAAMRLTLYSSLPNGS